MCAHQCVTNTAHMGWLVVKFDDLSFIIIHYFLVKKIAFFTPMFNWHTIIFLMYKYVHWLSSNVNMNIIYIQYSYLTTSPAA